jgi:hypothetical protein
MLHDQALERVRKLLAVAEHPNTPPAEADTAARAAERLIVKHAIDTAVLDAKQSRHAKPVLRRITVDPPYASAKTHLLGTVADAYGVRAVTIQRPYEPQVVSLVGFDSDLDLVDLLYTSLLLQAATSMLRQPNRGRAFRRAFLIGFAAEVGERLRAARQEAIVEAGDPTTALVLRDRTDEVEAAMREHFPRLRTQRMSVSDGGGLAAGRRSGAQASLSTNSNGITGQRRAIS